MIISAIINLTYTAQLQPPRAGASYRRAVWVPKAKIVEVKAQLLRNFLHREASGDGLLLPPWW